MVLLNGWEIYGISLFSLFLYNRASGITSQGNRTIKVSRDVLFQWNSSNKIFLVQWGLKSTDSNTLSKEIIYVSSLDDPPDTIQPWVAKSPYNGRVSFVGDLSAGHAWFKLTSVLVSDTNNYGAIIKDSSMSHGDKGQMFTAYLQVTEIPKFTMEPNATSITIENTDLTVTCSAIGPPSPNVTWFNVSNNMATIATGVGSAVLRIPKITRHYDGTKYKCQATNNPNEPPEETQETVIKVYYKPIIDQQSSTRDISSWKGNTIILTCKWSSAYPDPTFTWYYPNGTGITSMVQTIDKGSKLTIITGDSNGDYGLYRCVARNIAGTDQHFINVTRLYPPGAPNVSVTDIEASTVKVRWTEPTYNGGSEITGYKIECNGKEYGLNTSVTEYIVGGLTKYTNYTVKVYAKNVVGYGNAAEFHFTTKKKGPPDTPEIEDIINHKTSVTFHWTKPDDNGVEITTYTIYRKVDGSDDDWKQITQITGSPPPLMYNLSRMDTFVPGKTYLILVTATNKEGESFKDENKAKSLMIPAEPTTTVPPRTEAIEPSKGKSSGGGDGDLPFIIAGVVVAVILIVITAVISIIILRKTHIFGKRKHPPSQSAAYHNDVVSNDSLGRGVAVINVDDSIPTYAAVDMSKKTKKKRQQDEVPEYAAVDKSKKKKRPGEIIYAELADFNTNNVSAPQHVPTYTSTDYADITQFQTQSEPEPTYANFPGRNNEYNI